MRWLKRFDSKHNLLNIYSLISSFNNESIGSENKNILIISKNNKITFYRLKKENIELKNIWKQKFLNISYMNKRFEWINKTLEKAESLSNILTNKRFEDISNKELYEIYTQYVNTFTNIFQGYNLSQPEVPAVCEEELLKLINNTEIYSILTTPTKINPLRQEEIDWLNILLEIKTNGFINQTLNKIKQHSNNYGWFSTQEDLTFSNTNHYINLAKENNKTIKEIKQKIKLIEEKPIQIRKQRNKIINKLQDERIINYSKILRQTGYLRILKRLAWTKLEYSSNNMFEEISKRINYNHIKHMFPDEVKIALNNNKINREEIKKRIHNYIMHLDDGILKFYTEKEAKDIENKEIIIQSLQTNEVKGHCACQGNVIGKVKVIHSHNNNQLEEIKKMKQGDILVTGSTRPHLIVACRKALAIITDEGGICSHAAIVSRELNIPCIIGTKNATKIFKEGDLIELDAIKGIAKKIN